MRYCISSNDPIQDGHTALHVASQNGHLEIVIMLLEAKADINIKTNVSVIETSDDKGTMF